ncbi:MAG: EF-hand domain-containing protein [Methylosarcina sp.]
MKTFNSSKKNLWWPIVFGASLMGMVQSAHAEETTPGETSRTMERGGAVKEVPIFGQDEKAESTVPERPRNTIGEDMKGTGSETGTGVGGEGTGGTMEDGQDIKKSPSFQEIDKNGDHYVTKDELEGYPFLLKHFDMVDAGKDGKLEEHEYANLVSEKRRERGQ